MALPREVHVKISSEAAGEITMTPVVNQTMLVRDLVEVILGAAGKDVDRVRELLLRGSVVQRGSRFRWNSLEADVASLQSIFATFPDSDPARVFEPQACFHVTLRGVRDVELPRELASRKRFVRTRSYWDVLMDVASGVKLDYADYSYRDRGDRYRGSLNKEALMQLHAGGKLLTYDGLRAQLARAEVRIIELLARRS